MQKLQFMLHQSRATGDYQRKREGREMFQHVANLEGLVQINHGRAEPPHSRNSRGQRGAAVGMSQHGRDALAGQQHQLLLPQVRGHPRAGPCPEEPPLAPLLLPIAAHSV